MCIVFIIILFSKIPCIGVGEDFIALLLRTLISALDFLFFNLMERVSWSHGLGNVGVVTCFLLLGVGHIEVSV
jgi:hypothetical protein